MSIIVPYAIILATLYLFISGYVIRLRYKYKSPIGSTESKTLEFAMRGHANFAEYVPFTLILIGLCIHQGSMPWMTHALLIMLTLGRLMHAYCFLYSNNAFPIRRKGMILTFSSILLSTIYLLVSFFTQ